MLEFCLSYDIKITLKLPFWCENIKILSLYTQCCYGCHHIMLVNMVTIGGLSTLIHDIISLPSTMSFDKRRIS